MHQSLMDSRLTVMPRSARRSSMEWSGISAVAEIEAVVQPDSVGDDVRWESVSFICVHSPILPISAR